MPRVAWLTTTPVKGLALVDEDEVLLERDGVAHNRRFCLVDADGRRYGALRDGRLMQIRPRYNPAADRLELRFPDGTVVEDEVVLGEAVTTDLFQQPLPCRLVEGPWAGALSAFAGRPLRLLYAEPPGGSVDRPFGPVSIVSEASLAELGRRAGLGRPVDGRRFRMLMGIDGCAPHEEDSWCGHSVRIGEAVVRLLEPVARCAVTTKDPDTGRRDFDTLRAIKEYRGVRNGGEIDFGVVGDVVEPGRVRVGDPVELLQLSLLG